MLTVEVFSQGQACLSAAENRFVVSKGRGRAAVQGWGFRVSGFGFSGWFILAMRVRVCVGLQGHDL